MRSNQIAGLLLLGGIVWAFAHGSASAPTPPAESKSAPTVEMTAPALDFEKYSTDLAVRGGFPLEVTAPSDPQISRATWWRENPELAKAFQERRWRAEFAVLVIFLNECPQGRAGFNTDRSKMFAKWNALPDEQRAEAVNFEMGHIEKMIAWGKEKGGELAHVFGPGWECSYVADRIKEGKYDTMIYHPEIEWTPMWLPPPSAASEPAAPAGDLELRFQRLDGAGPILQAMVGVKNTTDKDYATMTWSCDLRNNGQLVGRNVPVSFNQVPKQAIRIDTQYLYGLTGMFNQAICQLVSKEELSFENERLFRPGPRADVMHLSDHTLWKESGPPNGKWPVEAP